MITPAVLTYSSLAATMVPVLGGVMSQLNWYKGNLHTHTTRSDGDSEPEVVARWYARHGYQFLVLSDHNHLTLLDTPLRRRRGWPLLIPGEEVTLQLKGGAVPVHLIGIGIKRVVEPVDADEVVPTLQANVNAIRQAGGLAEINHPNLRWAFDHEAIRQVKGAHLLEIYNGHPATNNWGGGGKPSCDEIWDRVLSSGLPIFGVAVDDAHHFKKEFNASRSNPGRGWIVVRASECSQESLLDAMGRGDFYASTGVHLAELEVSPTGMRLAVDENEHLRYTISFIGQDGRLLAQSFSPQATYEAKNTDRYFRAVVHASNGSRAWTQPEFLSPG